MESYTKINSSTNQTDQLDSSEIFVDITRKINIVCVLVILVIGFVGHALTTLVYSQRRHRLNSSLEFLLGHTVSDFLYLVIIFQGKYLKFVWQGLYIIELKAILLSRF